MNIRARPKSEAIYQKLCEVIPGGVNSPVRAGRAVGHLPLVAERAEGDLVYDVDGHAYIDFCCSWGAIIHGHAHPHILNKAKERMFMGSTFGITTPIEEALARKIIELLPSIDKIRFVSSGTEATMSAIRIARGFTGKPYIVKFEGNYHGHADFLLVKAGSGLNETPSSTSAGIPEEIVRHTICIPFNDQEAVAQVFKDQGDKIAGVILEPIGGNMGVIWPEEGFLQYLREITQKHGALLIFDEVMTGFRVHKQGVQGIYGIKPDLTCLAKVIGGGFPAAAFGGRKDVMDCLAPIGPVYQAGTLSGNPVAMEAGLQALIMLDRPGFYEEMERKTKLVTKPVKEWIAKNKAPLSLQEAGSMFTLFFGKTKVKNFSEARTCDYPMFAKFFQFMLNRGVYLPPLQVEPWFLSMAHTDTNLTRTSELIIEFLESEYKK